MDFVVAGLGFGALMVVVGFVVRDLGPFLRRRTEDDSSPNGNERSGRWRALCHGTADALTAGGVVVLLATIGAVLSGLSDSAGSLMVLVASVAGIAISGGLSTRLARHYRNGSIRVLAAAERQVRTDRAEEAGLSTQSTDPLSAATGQGAGPTPAESASGVAGEPHPDEPGFLDVHILLPEEIDHHSQEPNGTTSATANVPETPTESPGAVGAGFEPAAAESDTAGASGSAADEPGEAEDDDSRSGSSPDSPVAGDSDGEAEKVRTTSASGFASPLLADVAPEREIRPFSSRLLAGVETSGAETAAYRSPLLADLERPGDDPQNNGDGQTEARVGHAARNRSQTP